MKELDPNHIYDIIDKINDGNFNAFSEILDHYQHLAYSVAIRICKNKEDAEDITQEAFVKAFKNINSFSKKSKFSSWLYRIVYTTAITKINKKHLDVQNIEDFKSYKFEMNQNTGWSMLSRSDQISFIAKGMDSLSTTEGLVMTLFYLSEKSIDEIVEITGNSKSAIKVQLHRARRNLKIKLNKLLGEEIKDLI